MFKKKPYVRFVNEIPGVEKSNPIIPAKSQKYNWFKRINKDVIQYNNNVSMPEVKGNTSRCPGIVDLLQTGFIVTAPFDFVIRTNGQKDDFEWRMPVDPTVINKNISSPYISLHTAEQLHNYSPSRDDSLNVILKLNTYWRYVGSDDIVLLQMPIPYPDHNMFTACHGIIDTNKYNEMKIQLQWNKLEGEHFVQAGTPLCQLIPIPKSLDVELHVEEITSHDVYANKSYIYATMHKFSRDNALWKSAVKNIMDTLRKSINR
jgi:hypothetical protein